MSKLTGLKENIAAHLRSSAGLENAEVLTAYPGRERAAPLGRAAVAVGVDGAELVPAGLGGYLGEAGGETLYGAKAVITLRLDLYAPLKEDGAALHELYEAICEALVIEKNPFGVTRLTSGEITFDAATQSNRLTARGTLTAALLRGREEKNYTSAHVSV